MAAAPMAAHSWRVRPVCGVIGDSARGRALRMDAGAALCRGEILLFLHADTRLPDAADVAVRCAMANADRHWGRFDVRIDGRPAMLRVVAAAMNARAWAALPPVIRPSSCAVRCSRRSVDSLSWR